MDWFFLNSSLNLSLKNAASPLKKIFYASSFTWTHSLFFFSLFFFFQTNVIPPSQKKLVNPLTFFSHLFHFLLISFISCSRLLILSFYFIFYFFCCQSFSHFGAAPYFLSGCVFVNVSLCAATNPPLMVHFSFSFRPPFSFSNQSHSLKLHLPFLVDYYPKSVILHL